MFHHFLMELFFFQLGTTRKKCQIPAKSTQFPAQVRKSGFLHYWKSGFNKTLLVDGLPSTNLAISGLGVARNEKNMAQCLQGCL